ncbi:hypothetical protein Acor_06640 [Acrocarpospora corrugata]|uniref:Uncharacterized protein n=1 Tax=Acrocarpospora corrugata TaxID=35763 RepID=A0A5M3VU47_9ACTN|nr:hypothetical protein Acor_06640 [Acrocarpospora corrugata]
MVHGVLRGRAQERVRLDEQDVFDGGGIAGELDAVAGADLQHRARETVQQSVAFRGRAKVSTVPDAHWPWMVELLHSAPQTAGGIRGLTELEIEHRHGSSSADSSTVGDRQASRGGRYETSTRSARITTRS